MWDMEPSDRLTAALMVFIISHTSSTMIFKYPNLSRLMLSVLRAKWPVEASYQSCFEVIGIPLIKQATLVRCVHLSNAT